MSGSRGRAPFLFPECLEEHHSGSLCVIYNFPRVPHLSQSRFSGRNSENHRRPERFKGTSFSSNRNQRPSFQSRDRQSRRLSAFVPLSHLRHPEEFRGSSGYSKPQTDQRLHPTSTLQDGDSQCHSAEPLLSGLGGYHRSERRLSTCPYPSGLPASSRFLFPGPDIQLQGSAVRSQGLSLGLHQACSHSYRLPSSSGNSNLLLPRRLADCGDLAGSPPFSSTQNSGDHPEPWVPHQLEEILAEPSTASLLPGRPSRHSPSSRTPPRPPDFRPSCAHSEVDYLPFCSSFSLAEIPGPPSQSGGRSSQLQTPHATSTIASQPTFQSFSRPRLSSSTLTSQHQVFGTPVVVPRSSFRGKALLPPPPSLTLTTDASRLGWGAVLPPHHTSGPWPPQVAHLHINSLELLAVLFGLQSLEHLVKGRSVLVQSDNMTVVAYINHQGGTHSPSLCRLALELWEWCLPRQVHLSAIHIPGEENFLADFLSRGSSLPTEWMLKKSIFAKICQVLSPPPEIDLFASQMYSQLP